jgi:GDP-L-fucose synthase
MDSRIYVAGHAGLIGSALVRLLRARGCTNIVTRSRAELDLTDAPSVEAFFENRKPEFVLLAAGSVGGIVANRDRPADFLSSNLAIELNVINAAHRAGVKRLILFASSCMYPRETAQPMPESALFSGRPEPTSMGYAVAKIAGMQLCLAHNQQFGGKRFVPVIPNSVYGPGDNIDPATGHVLAALIARFHAAKGESAPAVKLWGSGKPRREFLYADDLAEACWLLLQADLSSVELPLNVGPGTDTSVRELAATIADAVGYRGEIAWDDSMPDGAPRKLLNSSRMNGLGWRAEVGLEEGIRRTYDWYRAHA